MEIPSVQTERLLLRAWTPADVDALFTILQEKDILRYFPNPNAPERSKVEAYISRHLAHWSQRGFGHWAVITPQDGRLIGWNGLEYLPELNEVEVAYLLSHQAWGRGYATEAAGAAIRFGFEAKGLEAIIGLVHPDNAASIHVLEKCGLRYADRIELWGLEMLRYRIRSGEIKQDPQ